MSRRSMRLRLTILGSFVCLLWLPEHSVLGVELGPLFARFPITSTQGARIEALGPFIWAESSDTERSWGISPFVTHRTDPVTDFSETEVLYPLLSYDRFGPTYRAQLLQIFNLSGGQTLKEDHQRRITIFPFYFQQRARDPNQNYTALFPVWGRLKNRLFRNEIVFVLFPAFAKTQKRDVVTWNYAYPFFHSRTGVGLKGWQFWPVYGFEQKEITRRTDDFGDEVLIGGHRKEFIVWPFYMRANLGSGTENPQTQLALLPFFTIQRSPLRDSSTYFWPLGFTSTTDREKKYREWALPWPLVVFARGEGKTANRIWPLFSQARNPTLESNFYLWPLYKYNRATAEPLDRERTRVLFFLYSDLIERNTTTGTALRRIDFWPLFSKRTDHDGNTRLQVLSALEPLIPNNKSIERAYSPLWSVWRSEKNPKTGRSTQSFLWNLYRREQMGDSKKLSILFGLIGYRSDQGNARWRLLFVPWTSGGQR